MLLYSIGVFITAGFLIRIDKDGMFDGWKGAGKFLIIIAAWPLYLGFILGQFANNEDNKE